MPSVINGGTFHLSEIAFSGAVPEVARISTFIYDIIMPYMAKLPPIRNNLHVYEVRLNDLGYIFFFFSQLT